jgi:hypothetical protein
MAADVADHRVAEGSAGLPLEIRLEPDGKGTRLTMFHSEVPAEHAERYARGWLAFYWKPLRRYLVSTRPIMRSRRPGNTAAKPARRRAGR